jgi:DinB superfamily
MDSNHSLRKELDRLLAGKGAHADFDTAVADLPEKLRGVRPEGGPHSPWEVLEHLRIAQHDMLAFSRDAKHESPKWPEGYWPKSPAPAHAEDWDKSVGTFRQDLVAMRKLVSDAESDLFTPFAHGEGQTLLREALQLADHNAYHVGEMVLLRRLLRAWKGGN